MIKKFQSFRIVFYAAGSYVNSCFSFLRLINMSPQEFHAYMFSGLLVRFVYCALRVQFVIHYPNIFFLSWLQLGDGGWDLRKNLLFLIDT